MSQASHISDLYSRVPLALRDDDEAEVLAEQLGKLAKVMMVDENARRNVSSPSLALLIQAAFSSLANAYSPATESTLSEGKLRDLGVGVGRLTRNLLAGVEENKALVIAAEPEIRRLCIFLTTFYRIQDSQLLPLQRALYQLLSNLAAIADHTTATDRARPTEGLLDVWTTEGDGMISRALESNDIGWNKACLMLVKHAIRGTSNGAIRIATHGSQIMLKIADKMGVWHDLEMERQDGNADGKGCFSIGCDIFNGIFSSSSSSSEELYARLGTPQGPTTAGQIVFLKLLDGRIDNTTRMTPDLDAPGPSTYLRTGHFLSKVFIDLSKQIRTAVGRLQVPTSHAVEEFNSFDLPKNLEACMLVAQGLNNLCLWEAEWVDRSGVEEGGNVLRETVEGRGRGKQGEEKEEVVESAIALLYSLDTLLPRLKPYRLPSTSLPSPPPDASPTPLVLLPPEAMEKLQPFAHLKRDLIRLIGTLAHRNKEIQDRVRVGGGVEMILSLCVVDDRSPYIREHALFAVRNLMTGNPENQAVINEMAPIGIVGEDGLLKEMPERMGLKKSSK